MPMYEYYCPTCKATFEKLRPMKASDGDVRCAAGHDGARRLVSAFVVGGRAAVAELEAPAAGGCACGGACGA
jgi:putative FmdB family regulatory protein